MYVTLNGRRIKISTREKLYPRLWNTCKKEVRVNDSIARKANGNELSRIGLLGVQKRLDELRQHFDRYFLDFNGEISADTLVELKSILRANLSGRADVKKAEQSVVSFLNKFISDIRTGKRRKVDGTNYKAASITCFQNLHNTILRYQRDKRRKITWEAIDRDEYNEFIGWHQKNGYSVNYTGRHIKELKSIMRLAYEEGIHANQEYRKRYFSVPKEVNKKIPLTGLEVQKLADLKLSEDYHLDLSRNIFLLGCYLGLRVSDLKRISPEFIVSSEQGRCIRMKTVKTSREVIIPISSRCDRILEKYSYTIPRFAEQVVSRHLKILAKMIGLSEQRQRTLSIHYSRATFAKHAFSLGIPSLMIMQITGHTSEQAFLRYINISPDEALRAFRQHEFFS